MPTCQFYSNDKYRVELHLPGIQYKCMVDILAMSMGAGQKKLLLLAREDLTNQVEGRALRNKTIVVVCKFFLEDVICQFGSVRKIVVDKGELNADEARELFDCLGVKISFTTAYNLEANGKIE